MGATTCGTNPTTHGVEFSAAKLKKNYRKRMGQAKAESGQCSSITIQCPLCFARTYDEGMKIDGKYTNKIVQIEAHYSVKVKVNMRAGRMDGIVHEA